MYLYLLKNRFKDEIIDDENFKKMWKFFIDKIMKVNTATRSHFVNKKLICSIE